jgi:hypothetical protein
MAITLCKKFLILFLFDPVSLFVPLRAFFLRVAQADRRNEFSAITNRVGICEHGSLMPSPKTIDDQDDMN